MRIATPIDQIADHYVDELVKLSPMLATSLGVPGSDHLIDDLSPEAHARYDDLHRETLAALEATPAVDEVDEVTIAAMRDRLSLARERYAAGDHLADVNNIASPVQEMRDVFALMPQTTVEHWEAIAGRMAAIDDALRGYRETLLLGKEQGVMPSKRAVADARSQSQDLAGQDSMFFSLARQAPAEIHDHVRRAAEQAASAYGALAEFFTALMGAARDKDAVGRERYARASREFVGSEIDLDETYEWGVESLAEISAEQDELARQIAGDGATMHDAIAQLDADPRYQIHGIDALRSWMQETADAAIDALNGTYFDISQPVQIIEACIAPTQTGGIYYTAPTEDFSRAGRMWWSVPAGVEEFSTWAEKTTVYHEGVPGHHLQLGEAVANASDLNRWRRLVSWSSGHGEGWALYAERLMEEFGFLDDPGDRFGMLDGQRLRATRVVVDLGVHLEKPAFEQYGNGAWDYDSAWALLRDNVAMHEKNLAFEFHRYLSWAGQAASYRIGQRIWEQIRAELEVRPGFNLKDFHTRALRLGSVPLDVLKSALTR